MLIIKRKDNNEEFGWYIGHPINKSISSVVSAIKADGEELEYIKSKFPSALPKSLKKTIFKGQIAKQIIESLIDLNT